MTREQSGISVPQWGIVDRLVILLIVPVFVLGTPGFGPENREFSNNVIPAILAICFLAPPIVAIALSWKMPSIAAKVGVFGGLLLIATAVLDMLGLIVGPPPSGMILVDALMLLVAVAITWRCWVLLRQ